MTIKNTILLTLTAAAGWLVFTSNSSGLGNSGGGDASASGCSCHGPNNSNTEFSLFSLMGNNGTVPPTNNQYTPGGQYVVSLVVKNNSGNTALTHFGFQTTARVAGGGNAGTLAGGNAAGYPHHNYTASGRTGVEHSALMPVVSSTPIFFQTSFLWTAPPAGSGAVTFFTAVNLVNNDGGMSGDQPNIHSITVQEGPATGIEDVKGAPVLALSPNPATDGFSLDTRTWTRGNYTVSVFSSTGQLVSRRNIAHRGAGRAEVRLPDLSTGLYAVSVQGEGRVHTAPLFIR